MSQQTLSTVQDQLARTGQFELERQGETLIASRRRLVPARGVFRLLIPRVRVHVAVRDGRPALWVRPDWVSWFILVLCAGGLAVELTMDRARYPREYPPAFIYGLTLFVLVSFGVEWVRSRSAAQAALNAPGATATTASSGPTARPRSG